MELNQSPPKGNRADSLFLVTLLTDALSLFHTWQLPYEIFSAPSEVEASSSIIVCEDGTLFQNQQGWGFGIAACIHGKHHLFSEDSRIRPPSPPLQEATACLLRVSPTGKQVVLQGPDAIVAKNIHEGPVALLMDFGRIICHFDYTWFADAYRAAFGVELTEEAKGKINLLRPSFEAGDLTSKEFFDSLRNELRLIPPDFQAFQQAWCGFLRLDPHMVTLLRKALTRPQTAIVIVSNIDPIVVDYARKVLQLEDLFQEGVFSYLPEVSPKTEDASMWKLARSRACKQLKSRTDGCWVIATDDTVGHLERARQEQACHQQILFRGLGPWLYALAQKGIYF